MTAPAEATDLQLFRLGVRRDNMMRSERRPGEPCDVRIGNDRFCRSPSGAILVYRDYYTVSHTMARGIFAERLSQACNKVKKNFL